MLTVKQMYKSFFNVSVDLKIIGSPTVFLIGIVGFGIQSEVASGKLEGPET